MHSVRIVGWGTEYSSMYSPVKYWVSATSWVAGHTWRQVMFLDLIMWERSRGMHDLQTHIDERNELSVQVVGTESSGSFKRREDNFMD